MSPEMIRELAALDAALAGEPVEPDLADLAELAALLHEERPQPDPTFARALDSRAERGFPRGVQGARGVPAPRGAARAMRSILSTLRSPLVIAPVATVLLITAVVGLSQISGGGDDSGSSGRGGASAGAPSTSAESGATEDQSAVTPAEKQRAAPQSSAPSPAPRSDPRGTRFVERSAAITLGARPDDLDDVADGVVRVTDAVGGFVASSSVTSGEEATFALRIPSDELPRAVRDLSRLAHVRERTQATEDITSLVVSARDRLEDARAERSSLLRRLARAKTDADAARLRARLRIVSRQIAVHKRSLSRVENRARFANVGVEIVADRSAAADDGGAWTPGDALGDAGRILEVAAGVIVVAGAALLPLSLVLGLAWLASRRAVRRRREGALDAV